MDPIRRELVDVLRECRALLARPDSDYLWSSWEDADAALEEIDGIIASIEQGEPLSQWWSVIFAPTGPMQEVSLSSGWGDEFLNGESLPQGRRCTKQRTWPPPAVKHVAAAERLVKLSSQSRWTRAVSYEKACPRR